MPRGLGGESSKAGDKTDLLRTEDGRPEDWGADLPKAGGGETSAPGEGGEYVETPGNGF